MKYDTYAACGHGSLEVIAASNGSNWGQYALHVEACEIQEQLEQSMASN